MVQRADPPVPSPEPAQHTTRVAHRRGPAWLWTKGEVVSLSVPSAFGWIRISTTPILLTQKALLRSPRRASTATTADDPRIEARAPSISISCGWAGSRGPTTQTSWFRSQYGAKRSSSNRVRVDERWRCASLPDGSLARLVRPSPTLRISITCLVRLEKRAQHEAVPMSTSLNLRPTTAGRRQDLTFGYAPGCSCDRGGG